ncbi:MAG: SDR family oxidoreductase [Planctomycetaceae bacterium]|nr:SDR family oxidoreductase [Planctomycetaceae bacterium]
MSSSELVTGHPKPSSEEVRLVMELLEQIAADRGLLEQVSKEEMHRLLRAAEKVALPSRSDRKRLKRAFLKREHAERDRKRSADAQHLARTGIRSESGVRRRFITAHPPEPFAPELPPRVESKVDNTPRLEVPRSCYICKREFDRLHHFYDALCSDCAALNWTKRHQTCDLTGRYALVTGGRVKIGYEAVLKLLRAGAHVIVTTRFPADGVKRFLAEADSTEWQDRVQVIGIDLRHTPSVEALCDHLCETLPRLDFILNNACQTVRRPSGFYAHLIEAERDATETLPSPGRGMLESYERLRSQTAVNPTNGRLLPTQVRSTLAGIQRAAELSQLPLVAEDHDHSTALFPSDQYDEDLQQVDLRKMNSWRLRLADVPTVELLEVHLVNAVAPFILNARLKPLMERVPTADKHIVNVSAMEGVFYRAYKTDKHPHTNMAKAALNMLTRTSAQDYAASGIHMNSVDTGWITDEDPAEIAARKQRELDFHPPLDQIDAAARICDPIFHGFLSGEHRWGLFLKDYQVANW